MAFIKISSLNNKINAYLKKLKSTHTNINDIQLLEPLSIIIKLAIINFKDELTKIAITNNKLYIQSPTFYQGIIRYLYGNNREDICFLLKPILRSIEIHKPNTNDDLIYIYELAISGLKKLKKSYKNIASNVCNSLDLYISILTAHLEGNDLSIDSYEFNKTAPDLNLSISTRVNLENIFQKIWYKDDIILISSMFKSAERDPQVTTSYIYSIENIIKCKEPLIKERIEQTKKFI